MATGVMPSVKGKAEETRDGSAVPPQTAVSDSGISVVYEPPFKPVLDIVFVHGLQGHPFKTWALEVRSAGDAASMPPKLAQESEQRSTSLHGAKWTRRLGIFLSSLAHRMSSQTTQPTEARSHHVFWPRDLLPNDCPGARVLVFGYDTVVAKHPFAGAANKNSVFAHGKALVNEVSRWRPLGRPILFVAHSLGGIVVKEMLAICSTYGDEDFGDILKSTAGVVFLGTPHRGSPAANMAKTVRKAASLLLMDTNRSILDSLSLRNSDLERCQDAFSSLWNKHGFCVKTFQEGLPLTIPIRLGQSKMSKVVPDISSCLGDSRERAETLNADHRMMCRYTGAADSNYKKVSGEVQAIYSTIPVPSDSDESEEFILSKEAREDILACLQFPEMSLRMYAIGLPAQHTCNWLFTTVAFTDWSQRQNIRKHRGFLQILGKPGSGKSVLMKHAFNELRLRHRTDGTCVAGFFFNCRGHKLERTLVGLLRALLLQIVTANRRALHCINAYFTLAELSWLSTASAFFNEHKSWLMDAMQDIFSNISVSPQRTILVIDALDECEDAATVGYFFAELTRWAYDAGVQLDVCVSRREYPSISIQESLEIRIETYIAPDIQQYVKQKLEAVDVSPHDAGLLQENVAQRSQGVFLWVVLAVERILKDIENGKNSRYVLKRSTELPDELGDLFTALLQGMDPQDRPTALLLFQWAILAKSPLRLREWHHILAFSREERPPSLRAWKESEYYTETDSQLERQIRSLSHGLVEVRGGGREDPAEAGGSQVSVLAGAGSMDSTTGDSRLVQPIHESVAQFFSSGRANKIFLCPEDYDFDGCGHLAIMGACLDYIGIQELDSYEAARGRRRNMLSQKLLAAQLSDDSLDRRRLKRRSSSTSFMSSASSHSVLHNNTHSSSSDSFWEDVNQHSKTDNKVILHPGKVGEDRGKKSPLLVVPTFLRLYSDRRFREGGEAALQDGRGISCWSYVIDWLDCVHGDSGSPEVPESLDQAEKHTGSTTSIMSQTLEEYPALASYVINKVFDHAQEAHARKADPRGVLQKSTFVRSWRRWINLQEGLELYQNDLLGFFVRRGLRDWIVYLPDNAV